MEDKKFELGPLQKEWIARLRAHPERQMKDKLGKKIGEGYSACCLGECGLMLKEKGLTVGPEWNKDGMLFYPDEFNEDVELSWEACVIIGLRSGGGELVGDGSFDNSLSDLNDKSMTWPEIADYIEANPENVFTKSV